MEGISADVFQGKGLLSFFPSANTDPLTCLVGDDSGCRAVARQKRTRAELPESQDAVTFLRATFAENEAPGHHLFVYDPHTRQLATRFRGDIIVGRVRTTAGMPLHAFIQSARLLTQPSMVNIPESATGAAAVSHVPSLNAFGEADHAVDIVYPKLGATLMVETALDAAERRHRGVLWKFWAFDVPELLMAVGAPAAGLYARRTASQKAERVIAENAVPVRSAAFALGRATFSSPVPWSGPGSWQTSARPPVRNHPRRTVQDLLDPRVDHRINPQPDPAARSGVWVVEHGRKAESGGGGDVYGIELVNCNERSGLDVTGLRVGGAVLPKEYIVYLMNIFSGNSVNSDAVGTAYFNARELMPEEAQILSAIVRHMAQYREMVGAQRQQRPGKFGMLRRQDPRYMRPGGGLLDDMPSPAESAAEIAFFVGNNAISAKFLSEQIRLFGLGGRLRIMKELIALLAVPNFNLQEYTNILSVLQKLDEDLMLELREATSTPSHLGTSR